MERLTELLGVIICIKEYWNEEMDRRNTFKYIGGNFYLCLYDKFCNYYYGTIL